MYQFQSARMTFLKIDAGDTTVIDLTEELLKVCTALMPHPCLGEEPGLIACLYNTVREIDILAKAHLGETTQLLIHILTDAHVERTGIELVELGLTASDATSGEKGGHRVTDGLLHRGEVGMGSVRTAKGSQTIFALHATRHILQIILRQHHIRIKNDEPFAVGTLGTIVATLSWSAVLLKVIMQIKDACELVANILAWFLRTVLYNHHLKVFLSLRAKTLKQLFNFVRTIEYGDDD